MIISEKQILTLMTLADTARQLLEQNGCALESSYILEFLGEIHDQQCEELKEIKND